MHCEGLGPNLVVLNILKCGSYVLIASQPGTKHTWSWEMIEGSSGKSMFACILEKILISAFRSDIGL